MNPVWIATTSIDYVKEFSRDSDFQKEIFFLYYFNIASFDCYMLTDASWIPNSNWGGVGFVIVNTYKKIVVAEANTVDASLALDVELQAVKLGLNIASNWASALQPFSQIV